MKTRLMQIPVIVRNLVIAAVLAGAGAPVWGDVPLSGGTPLAVPSMGSVAPGSGTEGDRVTATGGGFGSGGTALFLGGGKATKAKTVSYADTAVTLIVPKLAAGTYDLQIKTPLGTCSAPFEVVPPVISSVSAARGGEGDAVAISAANLGPKPKVYFSSSASGKQTGVKIASRSSDAVTVTVPKLAAGGYGIIIRNNQGAASIPFAVELPVVTGISTPAAEVGAAVTLNGAFFGLKGKVSLLGSAARKGVKIASYSPSRIDFLVPKVPDGAYGVEVRNAAGTAVFSSLAVGAAPAGHAVSGAVRTAGGEGVSGVLLTLGAGKTALTDAAGAYSFTGVADGAYTLSPSRSGYTFTPGARSLTVAGTDVTGADFTAAPVEPQRHSISGTVSGAVSAGVTVSLTGAATASAVTDAGGGYTFGGLLGGSYAVTPRLTGYGFTPSTIAVQLAGADAAGRNFTAEVVQICPGVPGERSASIRLDSPLSIPYVSSPDGKLSVGGGTIAISGPGTLAGVPAVTTNTLLLAPAGPVCGLGEVTGIPAVGYAPTAEVQTGHGYVAQLPDGTYLRMYVKDARSDRADIRYEYPFTAACPTGMQMEYLASSGCPVSLNGATQSLVGRSGPAGCSFPVLGCAGSVEAQTWGGGGSGGGICTSFFGGSGGGGGGGGGYGRESFALIPGAFYVVEVGAGGQPRSSGFSGCPAEGFAGGPGVSTSFSGGAGNLVSSSGGAGGSGGAAEGGIGGAGGTSSAAVNAQGGAGENGVSNLNQSLCGGPGSAGPGGAGGNGANGGAGGAGGCTPGAPDAPGGGGSGGSQNGPPREGAPGKAVLRW